MYTEKFPWGNSEWSLPSNHSSFARGQHLGVPAPLPSSALCTRRIYKPSLASHPNLLIPGAPTRAESPCQSWVELKPHFNEMENDTYFLEDHKYISY